MCDHANACTENSRQNPQLCEPCCYFARRNSGSRDLKNHNIGYNLFKVDSNPVDFRQSVCETSGILMIFVEAFRAFFKGNKSCRCNNSCLAHAVAQELKPAERS